MLSGMMPSGFRGRSTGQRQRLGLRRVQCFRTSGTRASVWLRIWVSHRCCKAMANIRGSDAMRSKRDCIRVPSPFANSSARGSWSELKMREDLISTSRRDQSSTRDERRGATKRDDRSAISAAIKPYLTIVLAGSARIPAGQFGKYLMLESLIWFVAPVRRSCWAEGLSGSTELSVYHDLSRSRLMSVSLFAPKHLN